jgi:hypothetical protein
LHRFFLVLLASSLPGLAQLPEALTHGGIGAVPPPDGKTLAGILRALRPESDSSWRGTLRIRRRGALTTLLPISSRVTVSETNWTVRYATQGDATHPAERLIVVHATNAPNQYFHARAVTPGADPGKPAPLEARDADIPFAGSDFLLSDLGLEFLHWPEQNRLKGELRRDRACHVLESKRPAATGEGYVRVVSWVDRETGGIIQAEAYNAESRQVKDFELGSFKKVNGSWQLQDMEMIHRIAGSRSKIEFDLGEEQ